MIDFYLSLRKRMTEVMQNCLRPIRKMMGYTMVEFGEVMGLTRQQINNIELGRSRMTGAYYLAVCALIDYEGESRPDLKEAVAGMLKKENSNLELATNAEHIEIEPMHNGSFVKKWFTCMPDSSAFLSVPQTNETLKDEDLRSIAENYKVFLDDSFLRLETLPTMMTILDGYMSRYDNQYIVSSKVVEGLQGDLLSYVPDQADAARRGLERLTEYQKNKLLSLRGDKDDTTLLATYVSVFAKLKTITRVAIFTQNPEMIRAVQALDSGGLGGFSILVLYEEGGFLRVWSPDRKPGSGNGKTGKI